MSPQGTIPKVAPPAPPKTSVKGAANVSSLKLSTRTRQQPVPKIVINAVEGWGKTSTVAHAPGAAILQARDETGYETLQDAGRVPDIPVARVESWLELIGFLRQQVTVEPDYKILALDAMDGFERLCHEHVCNRDFNGEWGEKGFASYQKGYDRAVTDWLQMLQALDALQDKGVVIVLLGHVQIRPFKSPDTEDYDRYTTSVHHKTWAVTHKWADAVLFGKFRTIIDDKGNRAKAIGGKERVLYTEHRDAWDAKNRLGLPEQIDVPDDPAKVWETITSYIGG